jgi:hypothetical protein
MPLPSSSLTGVTFKVSSDTQTIPLNQLHLGQNSIEISNTNIINTLNNVPQGSSVNAYINFSYANGLQVVDKTISYTPPLPSTNEQIISVTRGYGQLILVRFSTLNGRIPVVGSTTFRFYTNMDNYQLLTPYSIIADADNTSSRSFFTASMMENFNNPLPNFLVKVVLFTGSSESATLYSLNL